MTLVADSPEQLRIGTYSADASSMAHDLEPLRHAQHLLSAGKSTDDVIAQLRAAFDLNFVDAMAAVASAVLLTERGLTVPEARPRVA